MADQLLETARAQVRAFIQPYDELEILDEEPDQSATNSVLFGKREDQQVVYKYFVQRSRKWQEEHALRDLAASGVVPRIYAYPSEDILVMERLAGRPLWQEREHLDAQGLERVYRQIGAALARLVAYAAPPAQGDAWKNPYEPDKVFWNTPFEEYFDRTLSISRFAIEKHQIDAPELIASLDDLEAARSDVLAFPLFMHVDDVHGGNMLVDGDQFQGFIDFEMSRPGNELYLLGATLQWACLDNPQQWPLMLSGYETFRGEALAPAVLNLVRVFATFQNWCRFSWYWGSEEQPDWVWERNVRPRILGELIDTLAIVDSVVYG